MKKIIFRRSTVSLLAVLTAMLFITSCKKENPLNSENSSALSEQQAAPLRLDLVHEPIFLDLFIEDANMQPAVGDNTLIWDKFGHVPIPAPDGHQVTLGEFSRTSGYAEVKCVNAGTHVVIHFKDLIPNGVYSIWVATWKSPGFDATLANEIGQGALGAPDGSQNAFTASPAGTASLSVIMPAGSLSQFGTVGNCFSSEYELQLAAAYHLDIQAHGATPGDDSTFVIPFIFSLHGSQL